MKIKFVHLFKVQLKSHVLMSKIMSAGILNVLLIVLMVLKGRREIRNEPFLPAGVSVYLFD